MLLLCTERAAWGLPCRTPSGLVCEAYLSLLRLPFVVERCLSPQQSPTGALPAIDVDESGCLALPFKASVEPEAASHLVLQQIRDLPGGDLDAALAPVLRAESAAFSALIMTDLAPAVVYFEWVDPARYVTFTRPAHGLGLPLPLNFWLPARQRAHAQQALGSVVTDEAGAKAKAGAVFDALAARLAASNGPFLLGETASTADALAMAYLLFAKYAPAAEPLAQLCAERPTLGQYVDRHVGAAFPSQRLASPPPRLSLPEIPGVEAWLASLPKSPAAAWTWVFGSIKPAAPTVVSADEVAARRRKTLFFGFAGVAAVVYLAVQQAFLLDDDAE